MSRDLCACLVCACEECMVTDLCRLSLHGNNQRFKTMNDSSSDEDFLLIQIIRNKLKRNKRTEWISAINQERNKFGQFTTLISRVLMSDSEKFFNYFRMNQDQFEVLLSLVKNDIAKQDTSFRRSISARERLSICLRFLATGDSYASLHYNYRVGKSTISKVIIDVCEAIWRQLMPIYMSEPTQEKWEEIEEIFHKRWNLPNCIGAIDGKHVVIKAPENSGSLYHNYKGTHSIVLMAVVDSSYNFTVVDVGGYGSNSDGGVFSRMGLSRLLSENMLNIPPAKNLPNMPEVGPVPHFIVGDEAFPLKPYLMRPYPGKNLDKSKRIYNYRHSRSRRISENAFAILASKFRMYHRKLELCPDNVDKVVLATCVLHNYIRKTGPAVQLYAEKVSDGEESGGFMDLERVGHHSSKGGFEVREALTQYVNSEFGSVDWQDRVCFGHAK